MKRDYKYYFFNWTTINKIGRIKLLRSSFVIFFLLPIIAQLFEQYEINLEIPISWLFIYYSTLFISVSTLLYGLFCPQIISEYSSFEEFDKSGKGGVYLFSQISTLTRKKVENHEELIKELTKYTDAHFKTRNGIAYIINSSIWGAEKDDFWFVHNTLNYSKTVIRIICSLLYAIGFTLLGIVFVEKIVTVTEYFLNISNA